MKSLIVNLVIGKDGETHLPLGPLYIANVFEREGIEVQFKDYQFVDYLHSLNINNFLDFINEPVDILGISCYSNTLPLAVLALKKNRFYRPDQIVILGGPGPSVVPVILMQHCNCIDIIVVGEGEETVSELSKIFLSHVERKKILKKLSNVNGIIYRDNDGNIIVNPPRQRIKNLDIYRPSYHLLDNKKYDGLAVMTSRGCPFRCTFCQVAPLWGRTTVFRKIESVINEIDFLVQLTGANHIRIADDTMTLSKERVIVFSRLMKEQLSNTNWSCLARINSIDNYTIETMHSGGCVGLLYGVESGSQSVLYRINKKYTSKEIIDAVARTISYIKNIICTFIWGFPFESINDFYESIFLMGKLSEIGASIKFLHLMPAPMSIIYREFHQTIYYNEEEAEKLINLNKIYDNNYQEDLKKILEYVKYNKFLYPNFFCYHDENFYKKSNLVNFLNQ